MADKPNVTVIYQDAKPSTPGLGDIIRELFATVLIIGVIALFSGGCAAWWLW